MELEQPTLEDWVKGELDVLILCDGKIMDKKEYMITLPEPKEGMEITIINAFTGSVIVTYNKGSVVSCV